MKKIIVFCEILVLFAYDFFIAVLHVAGALFKTNERLHPVILRMPTVLKDDRALWCLSLIISLTPGSLVVDISKDKSILYIHFFHAPDPEHALSILQRRFETRLKFLFSKGTQS